MKTRIYAAPVVKGLRVKLRIHCEWHGAAWRVAALYFLFTPQAPFAQEFTDRAMSTQSLSGQMQRI